MLVRPQDLSTVMYVTIVLQYIKEYEFYTLL